MKNYEKNEKSRKKLENSENFTKTAKFDWNQEMI